MLKAIKDWLERVLEKPFFQAEMIRAEILIEQGRNNKYTTPKNYTPRLKQV